jgi:hypothetical protein
MPRIDPKPRPHHAAYIEGLRRTTGEQRMLKAFELGAMARSVFEEGLRATYPELSPEEFRELLRERLALCHNRNY